MNPSATRAGTLDRRTFLRGAGVSVAAAMGAGVVGPGAVGATTRRAGPRLEGDPFALGVASGDPSADGFVLWTRLTQGTASGGGMPAAEVPVRWMVSSDEGMRTIVARDTVTARPDRAHAVHVVVTRLSPDRPYWYRFVVGDDETPVARTRTLPASDARPRRLDFGFASCQNFCDGYYGAWGDVASDDDLDLVVFLGDYIYESGLGGAVRAHDIPEVVTLEQYRNRYALYRSDPHLRAAHACAPWLVTWDDHEVDNNYQGSTPEASSPTQGDAFPARRAAAYRAWWEHMPTRLAPPNGPDLRIFRRADFGRLARFHVLDTRQYRSNEPCAPASVIGPVCDAARAPEITVLGAEQERWLDRGLATSRAVWDVIAQQVVFSAFAFTPGAEGIRNLDQWDGYPEARRRVLRSLRRHDVRNPVVITGDVHASFVGDIPADFERPGSARIGTEFVGTSISSSGSPLLGSVLPTLLANSPALRWGEVSQRGWVRCTVTPEEWRADYRTVADARVDGSPVTTSRSWVAERDRPVEAA
ncbi:MAG: alkaline phosphatase D family protein [Actinomycetota bacterium]